MNLTQVVASRGSEGTISRIVFDKLTGMELSRQTASVKIGLARRDYATEIAGVLVKQPTVVILSKELLEEEGFPVPVVNGDVVEVDGLKATVKHVIQRSSDGTSVYYCQADSGP